LDDRTILNQLEELAERLGIEIRYGNLGAEESRRMGGLCRVQGKHFLIMHSRLTRKEKIGVIVKALQGFESGDIYIRPVIRELLDRSGDPGASS
jgi:hypothetical protein